LVPGEITIGGWPFPGNAAVSGSLDKDPSNKSPGWLVYTIVTVAWGGRSQYQPKIIRKHARGVAIVALLSRC
jgi:hypothetical protein